MQQKVLFLFLSCMLLTFGKLSAQTDLPLVTASYIGGAGDDEANAVGIQSNNNIVIAGKIDDTGVNYSLSPHNLAVGTAAAGGKGVVLRLSPDGTTLLSVTRVGQTNSVEDMALHPTNDKIAVTGPYGFALLNATADAVLWSQSGGDIGTIDFTPIYSSGRRISVGTDGTVAALYNKNDEGLIYVYDESGSPVSGGLITVPPSDIGGGTYNERYEDITVDAANQLIIITGTAQRCPSYMTSFVMAYSYATATFGNQIWKNWTWWCSAASSHAAADTRGIRVEMSETGDLLFAGYAHGGNNFLRYDPNDYVLPPTLEPNIVDIDTYSNFSGGQVSGYNSAFIAKVNPATGDLIHGQFHHNRNTAGNKTKFTPYAVAGDNSGKVIFGGNGAAHFISRTSLTVNGAVTGPYTGGEGYFVELSSDFTSREQLGVLTFNGTTAERGNSKITAVAARGTRRVAISTAQGRLFTSSPIQSTITGGWKNEDEIYFAFWDVNSLDADFTATPTTIPEGNTVTFTDTSIGATSWDWTFPGGSPASATGAGPHVVTYPSAGNYDATLSINGGADTETKTAYITVESPGGAVTCTPVPEVVITASTVVGSGTPASCTEAALAAAVAGGGQITFNSGGSPVTITLTGELTITANTVIDGAGLVTLDGNNVTRIINKPGGFDLTLQNLKFVNANAPDPGTHFSNTCGGAILAKGAGNLDVIDCEFTNNQTFNTSDADIAGGAIYIFNVPQTRISGCLFQNNTSSNGGAIGNLGGDLLIYNSTFETNEAVGLETDGPLRGHGGAINIDGVDLSGTNNLFELCGVNFIGNSSENQGGATNSVFTDNTGSQAIFDRCHFENNSITSSSSGQGGAVFHMEDNHVPAGASENNFDVTNSTFNGNTCWAQGGGIWTLINGNVLIENCTFDQNTLSKPSSPPPSAAGGQGGGLAINQGIVMVRNCTFSQNFASLMGGGIQIGGTNNTTLANCIFDRNLSEVNWQGYQVNKDDSADGGGNIQFPANRPIHGTADKLVTPTANIADPLLLPLTDNGGPTPTMALNTSSPAIDTGTSCGTAPATDQRGEARVGICDVGAYEFASSCPSDVTAPTFSSCPVDQYLTEGVDNTISGIGLNATATDDCSLSSLTNDFNSSATLNGETFPLGVTTVIWTATDASGNSTTCSYTVTVTSALAADFSGAPASICIGESVTFTDASVLATSYAWNFGAGATPATAVGIGPHTVTYSTAGSKTVSLTINGGADTETKTNYVTVNSAPAAPTASNATACAGAVIPDLSAAGTGIQWYSDAGLTTMVGTGTSYTHGHTAAGTYTYYATQTVSGCESPATTVTLTINTCTTPTADFSGTPTTICTGESVTFTDASFLATSHSWSFGAGATPASAIGAGPHVVTYSTAGLKTVRLLINGGADLETKTDYITVNAIPAAPAASNVTACAGGTIPNLTATGTNLQWYSDAALTTLEGTGASFAHGETAAGTYTYYVTQTVSGCESPSTTVTLTIGTSPAAPAASSITNCIGSITPNLTATGTGIQWYSDAGLTTMVGTGTSYTHGHTAAGTYTYYVTQTVSGCESPSTTVTLTIGSSPSAPTASSITDCTGSVTANLTATGTGIQWYSDAGLTTMVSTGASYTHGHTVAGTYTYYVTQNISGCESPSTTVTLTINSCTPPNVSDFTRITTEGTPIPFSPANFFAAYSDADGDPMTKVRIESLPVNGTLIFGGSPVVIGQEIPGASLGSLVYAPTAGYTGPDSFGWNGYDGTSYATTSANVNITVLPSPPPPPPGGGGGSTVTLFAPGWISAIGQDTASIELTWQDNNVGETGYEIYRRKEDDSFFALVEVVGGGIEEVVTYLDTEGLEPDTRYSYYVKPLSGTAVGPQSDVATDYTYPLMPDLVNVIKACQDGTGSIEVSGEHRSNKFKWYRTEDALSSEAVKNLDGSDFTDPVFETDVISSPRTYYVTSQGQRYESEPRLAVTVGIKPRPVAEILSDSTGIFSCDNSVLVQAQTQDSASYTWLRNGSEVGTTSVNEFTAVQSGKYTVLVEKDGCTTLSEEVTVSLNYEPFVEIDTRGPFCEGGLLRTSGENGLTYTWMFDSLVIGEGAEQVIDSSGVYTLIAEKFGCQTTLEVDVTVNNFPAENTIAASSLSLCDGGDVTLTAPFAEGMAYRWFRDGGELGGSGQSIRATAEGTYSVTLTFPGGCEKTLEALVLEEVSYQKPEITQDLNTLTLVLDSTATVDSVTWYRNSIVQPAFNGMTSIEAAVDGTYWAYVQYSDGCEDLSETIRFIFEVTGTEDVREELGLVVYPNPFGSRLSIRTEKPIGSLELAVIDDLGRTVMTRSFESSAQKQTFELDMSHFASGLYTLRFISDKGVFTQKVMKAE